MEIDPESPFDEQHRRRVAANLARFERRSLPLAGRRPASVAVVLLPDTAGRTSFLLTLRAALRRHSGQFALPGGRRDPGESDLEAALRELDEEVGLALGPGSILGMLDDYPTRSGFLITPVVMWCEEPGELAPDPREVARLFRVPVVELARREEPRVEPLPESGRPVLSLPLLGTRVFAPTAAVLFQLVEVAYRGRATRVAHYDQPRFAWR